MSELKKLIKNKRDFHEIYSLYPKQPWLIGKEKGISELLNICDTNEEKQLILKLLRDFNYLTPEVFNNYLNDVADFIVNESAFSENTTQVSAITFDDNADSSQKILDQIKMPLFQKGWGSCNCVNRFGAIVKNYNKGLKQIILVDEFVGTGQTIVGRIKQLKNDLKGEFELKLGFIAGMEMGLRTIEQLGYEVFCPLRLPQGINDIFSGEEFGIMVRRMLKLELKLAKEINIFNLEDYSFGYNNAQALYSMEGCGGNTPNSVFPIFWWPRNANSDARNTLLSRYEKGLK